MSHFAVLVVVPKNDDYESNMVGLLEPYSENLEVPEYEESCCCVNTIASNEARNQAEKIFGSIGDIRNMFFERADIKKLDNRKACLEKRYYGIEEPPLNEEKKALFENLNDKISEEYKTALIPYNDYIDRAGEEHPMFNKANPDCSECNGTGVRTTTYNPDSKWDWYEIGGRWNDFLDLGSNIIGIPTIIEAFKKQDKGVYAIVTPDGAWHEKGEMGWWGISSNENENWNKDMFDVLEEYNSDEYIGIIVDCHI